MKAIVAAEGGDTDDTHDHEYTDWDAVEQFAEDVHALVRADGRRAAGETEGR